MESEKFIGNILVFFLGEHMGERISGELNHGKHVSSGRGLNRKMGLSTGLGK